MGTIVKITCGACGKEWECRTGCGLLHASLQDVVREFPGEMGKDITKRVSGEEFPAFDFAYHISKCDTCGDMVSIPVLKLSDHNAQYIGGCPICANEVKTVADLGSISCPACGEKALADEYAGNWD